MLSKAKIKYIHSLELKKNRTKENAFVAEGPKLVGELLGSFSCHYLAALPQWLENHPCIQAHEIEETNQEALSRASFLKSPQEVIAVFELPHYAFSPHFPRKDLCLALDGIQDPGNLGTIVRLADWYGIEHVYCSPQTADIFNPKTVQATMGALARVQVHYTSLAPLIEEMGDDVPVYGTLLDGDDMYAQELSANGLLVMGNEGNGISPEIERLVTHRLYIPHYPAERPTSESLNVAVATAIVCAEFRRRRF